MRTLLPSRGERPPLRLTSLFTLHPRAMSVRLERDRKTRSRLPSVSPGYLVDPARIICLFQRLSHASPDLGVSLLNLRKAPYICYDPTPRLYKSSGMVDNVGKRVALAEPPAGGTLPGA